MILTPESNRGIRSHSKTNDVFLLCAGSLTNSLDTKNHLKIRTTFLSGLPSHSYLCINRLNANKVGRSGGEFGSTHLGELKLTRDFPSRSKTHLGCQLGLPDNALVSKTCIRCFREGRPLRRYRYGVGAIEHMLKVPGTCTTAHSLPSKEVTKRADLIINNGLKAYDVPKFDSEDFSLYCKTSRMVPHSDKLFTGTSRQAKGLYALYLALVAGTGAAGVTYSIDPYDFEHIRRAGYSSILGTLGQRYRLLRVASMSFAAVSALTCFSARHNYDIAVRSDAVVESSEDLIKRLDSKKQPMSPAPES
nr:NC domain-containing protein-like protein [Tanacetum cinerariifolium]